MTKRPTMTDIGARAGVSQATVSLVLNNVPNARVSAMTRKRVFAAAEALGYVKGPRHGVDAAASRVVALLIDELATTPFVVPLIEGAQEEAERRDAALAVFWTKGDPTLENAALDIVAKSNLAGVLYATLITREVSVPQRLAEIPTILLNCHAHRAPQLSVVPGDVAGAFAATEHLLKAGHRRIAHLAGETWIEAARDRERGFRQALATWDVAVDPDLVIVGGWTMDGGRRLALDLIDAAAPPTAIFCFNDRMAAGAYDAARIRGLRVPEDLSIVGFDDEEISSYLTPPLTTVVLPHDEMARWAAESLLAGDGEGGRSRPSRTVKIECPLMVRQSVAPPRPALRVGSAAGPG